MHWRIIISSANTSRDAPILRPSFEKARHALPRPGDDHGNRHAEISCEPSASIRGVGRRPDVLIQPGGRTSTSKHLRGAECSPKESCTEFRSVKSRGKSGKQEDARAPCRKMRCGRKHADESRCARRGDSRLCRARQQGSRGRHGTESQKQNASSGDAARYRLSDPCDNPKASGK